jgi:hypothetical protein
LLGLIDSCGDVFITLVSLFFDYIMLLAGKILWVSSMWKLLALKVDPSRCNVKVLYAPSGQTLFIALKVDPSLAAVEECCEVLSDVAVTHKTLCIVICTLQIKDMNNDVTNLQLM